MKIVVGLGNYGTKYEKTRHNVGFDVLSLVADSLGLSFKKKECKSLIAEGFCRGEKFVLAKPQTYMNLSGEAVKELVGKYKAEMSEVMVISDDLDLPLGQVRIRKSGGAGTHNGMRNIIAETNSKDFLRTRVGIGEKPNENMDLADFVLGKFSKEDLKTVTEGYENAKQAVLEFLEGEKIDIIMGKHNR